MPERTAAYRERRRSPRFVCGGYANISWLPSEGRVLPGAIRDLSLGGCHLDTALPISAGVRAEILVRVNSASFRALGEIKAIRDNSSVGVEFVQLSSGGKNMLTDLVTDLARLQAVMNKLKAMRRDMDAESWKEELQRGRLQAMVLGDRFPFLRTTLCAENLLANSPEDTEAEQVFEAAAEPRVVVAPRVVTVDLFG